MYNVQLYIVQDISSLFATQNIPKHQHNINGNYKLRTEQYMKTKTLKSSESN